MERTWQGRVVAAPLPKSLWGWECEPIWLFDEIARDVVETVWFAQRRTPAPDRLRVAVSLERPATSGRVRVQWPGRRVPVEMVVALQDGLWNPSAFVPLAKALLGPTSGVDRPNTSSSSSSSLVLTDPLAQNLKAEDDRLSAALALNPLDAQAHAEAALLLVTFALREPTDRFTDRRPILCRATAHLSLAMALGADDSLSTSLARAGLLTLVEREGPSEALLAQIEKAGPNPAQMAWIRALHVRNTGDWRIVARPVSATFVERREYLAALREHVGEPRALRFLSSRNTERVPDWAHALLRADSSEAAKKQLSPQLFALQIDEAAAILGVDKSRVLAQIEDRTEQRFVSASKGDAGQAAVAVIGEGAWRQYFHRRICSALLSLARHIRERTSVEELKAFWSTVLEPLRGTDAEALILIAVEDDKGFRWHEQPLGYRDRLVEMWERRPQAIPPGLFRAVMDPRNGLPEGDRWKGFEYQQGVDLFETPPASGSSFNCPQARAIHALRPRNREAIEQLTKELFGPILEGKSIPCETPSTLAPTMTDFLRQRQAFTPTLEQFEAFHAPLLGYDLSVLRKRAGYLTDRPDEYVRELRRIADLDDDSWAALGAYLARLGRDDEAAEAYEKAIDDAGDRVALVEPGLLAGGLPPRQGRDRPRPHGGPRGRQDRFVPRAGDAREGSREGREVGRCLEGVAPALHAVLE